MDLSKTIQDLYAEKEKLERVIASLEELQREANATSHVIGRSKRRGRKSMGSTERQEVSERMKKYWASRRVGGHKQPEDPEHP
jgi:seryl-tRNA synthetase